MKVILAGLPKTGTKTLNAALTKFGYNVYDNLEHFMFHYDDWKKIFKEGGTVCHFKEMYKNVDAVVDAPACFFWKEIHKAFPEAKVILTVRNEENWLKSLQNQLDQIVSVTNSVSGMFSKRFVPIVRKFMWYTSNFDSYLGLKTIKTTFSTKIDVVDEVARQKFRKHDAMVQKEISRDKLLVYSVTEEWEPLCEFLNEEIPKEPFPHKNAGGKDLVPSMNEHKFGKQAFLQLLIAIVVMLAILVLVLYFLNDYPVWVGITTFLCGFSLLFYVL